MSGAATSSQRRQSGSAAAQDARDVGAAECPADDRAEQRERPAGRIEQGREVSAVDIGIVEPIDDAAADDGARDDGDGDEEQVVQAQ